MVGFSFFSSHGGDFAKLRVVTGKQRRNSHVDFQSVMADGNRNPMQ